LKTSEYAKQAGSISTDIFLKVLGTAQFWHKQFVIQRLSPWFTTENIFCGSLTSWKHFKTLQ